MEENSLEKAPISGSWTSYKFGPCSLQIGNRAYTWRGRLYLRLVVAIDAGRDKVAVRWTLYRIHGSRMQIDALEEIPQIGALEILRVAEELPLTLAE